MSDDFDDIDLDFSGVSREGGAYTLLPEGQSVLTIANILVKKASNGSVHPVVHVHYESGDTKPRDYFSLDPNALFNFRDWLEAVTGMSFDGAIRFDAATRAELIGKQVGANITVTDHYQKKKDKDGNVLKQNNIESYFAV